MTKVEQIVDFIMKEIPNYEGNIVWYKLSNELKDIIKKDWIAKIEAITKEPY